ncbi:MAG: type II toxin-antitoxin system RelE/ParE family toxin [Ginsengibacter sp.]
MKYRIELHNGAQKELAEAFHWYEKRSIGLGVRFIQTVNKKLSELSKYPERYAKRKAEFREVSIPPFPYILIYEFLTEEKVVFISYVFHTKRNPGLKYRRIR